MRRDDALAESPALLALQTEAPRSGVCRVQDQWATWRYRWLLYHTWNGTIPRRISLSLQSWGTCPDIKTDYP